MILVYTKDKSFCQSLPIKTIDGKRKVELVSWNASNLGNQRIVGGLMDIHHQTEEGKTR